ncbi:MAG TPA: acyltransferase [Pyrinomonadaceae bacterium]|nr:acyltransferase [Pyrinomonadaceae bacterium]
MVDGQPARAGGGAGGMRVSDAGREGELMEAAVATVRRDAHGPVALLDFCKGVAIAWVVLVHARHGWFGWQGVHVFVLLGGFTLTHACLRRERPLAWGRWLRRRAERILPAYWAVATAGFLVLCGVAALAPNVRRPFDLSVTAGRWLADLTLLRNFSYKMMLADPNSALWFVPLVATLYLAFPWLYSSLARRGARGWVKVLLAAAAVEVIYRAAAVYWLDGVPVGYGHGFVRFLGRPEKALNEVGDAFPFQLWAPFGLAPSRVGEFALGMVGAFALREDPARFERLLLGWRGALCGVVAWLCGNFLLLAGRWAWAFADLVIAAGLVLWLVGLAGLVRGLLPKAFRLVSRLGEWSYYVFLTHLLFGYAYANLYTLWAGSTALAVLMLLLTLAAAVASCRLLRRLDRSELPRLIFHRGAASPAAR